MKTHVMMTLAYLMVVFVAVILFCEERDGWYMKVTRIINSITQWLKVLQKFAFPRHTVAQDGTCGVDRWAWYVFGGRSRT